MRHLPIIVTIAAAVAVGFPLARHLASAEASPRKGGATAAAPTMPHAVEPHALTGVELARMHVGKTQVTAPAVEGRVAHLSVDPELQGTADKLMRKLGVPEGSGLLMDLKTGKMLVYASRRGADSQGDPSTMADAPAASVFKLITAAALVEHGKAAPDTRQCYRGGRHSIQRQDLLPDAKKDRWCATVSEAMGRSLNTVFARLAAERLTPTQMVATAGAFGFGLPMQFDVPVEPSKLELVDSDLEFARTAAGFWNSTLSPVHALMIASTVANRGTMLRPVLVSSVSDAAGQDIYRAPAEPQVARRPIRPETADALRTMMESTVSTGTAYHAFHDPSGRAFLPNIRVAGKTGTLTRNKTKQFYTWFVGFAPSDNPEIAFATLVINRPKWQTKAPLLARELLRAYFASKGAPGVTKPQL